MRGLGSFLQLLLVIALALALGTCSGRPSLLQQVRILGTLRVATVNLATTYYFDADRAAGFEYDLVRAFADRLGLALDMIVLPSRDAVVDAVAEGSAHIGAGLAVSEPRRQRLRFTPPYASSKLEAVYRAGRDKPEGFAALSGKLAIPADTALADWLRRKHSDLDFRVAAGANAETLMSHVVQGKLGATIASADIVAMNQRYYPLLRVAFELPGVRRDMAWAFAARDPANKRDELYNKAIAFLEQVKNDGRLHIWQDRYFGHVERLGFVGGHEFARQVDARLDQWRGYFRAAGAEYRLDWRLLAAIGYQESHWDADAVSPTAVRGIMMLTRATAKDLDISNRRDPRQSIDGGARYLVQLLERLPDEIKKPDRTWFALAAYNMGYGHVMDARRLLEARNRNPNLWVNLREALSWLTRDRYLAETRHGYARGLEAKAYVGNIRAYYDILVWMTEKNNDDEPKALAIEKSAGVSPNSHSSAIAIDSPAF